MTLEEEVKQWRKLQPQLDELSSLLEVCEGINPLPIAISLIRKYIMEQAIKNADRRQDLSKSSPCCPDCSEVKQIQLLDSFTLPARWRCRECYTVFYYEPNATSSEK